MEPSTPRPPEGKEHAPDPAVRAGAGSASPHPSVWSRLKAGRVPQLLGVYAGGSFAVLQAADIFVDRLGLPDWTFFGLVAVLVAGLPAIVATALVQSGGVSFHLRGVFNWRNTALFGVGSVVALALAVGLFMGARSLGIGPVGSLVAAGVLDRNDAILIADFQASSEDEPLAAAVTEAFRIDLEQSPMIRLVAPGAVREGLLRMQEAPDAPLSPTLARELALREGIKALVVGEINRVGGSSIISVRLVATDTEESLVSFRETVADSAGVLPAVDRLSDRMRERIGESLRTIRDGEPLERVSTSSLPALRRYSQAVRAVDRERNHTAGVLLLQEALEHDSTFAMAWRKLGVTLRNEGYPREDWEEPLTRAYQASDRLTERERYMARAMYYWAVQDDQDRAATAYRAILDTYPNDGAALNNLAVIHIDRGEREQGAELLRRALASDSTLVLYFNNLIRQEILLRDWEAAETTLEALRRRFPELPAGSIQAAHLASVRGHYEESERILLQVVGHPQMTPSEEIDARWALAGLAAVRGRLREAERRLGEVWEVQDRLGYPSPAVNRELMALQIQLHIRADTAGALAGADALRGRQTLNEQAALQGAHLQLAFLYAQAGRAHHAQQLALEWDEAMVSVEGPSYLAEVRESLDVLLTLVLEENPAPALTHHRRQIDRGVQPAQSHYALAETFRRVGEPDSAIAHYEAALVAPTEDRLNFDAFLLPTALERLGDLYLANGEPERARNHLQRFVELWAEADPELQPRVQSVRRRLEG